MSLSESERLHGGDKVLSGSSDAVHPRTSRDLQKPAILRLIFLFACAFTAGTAISLTKGSSVPSADPDLAKLLKGMAIIKTAILLAVCSLIWWRLGSSIRPSFAAGYVLFGAIAIAGAALVWNMTGLGLAPFLFDGGLLAFLVLALRDDNGPWLRALTRSRSRRSE